MYRLQQNRTIDLLIIEENPVDVRLLQESFQEVKANVRIQVATDGAEGLQMAQGIGHTRANCRPDLILLDLNLPKVSGYEVLQRLKKDPQTCRIPVLVLASSSSRDLDLRRVYECHANAYISKPSSSDGYLAAALDIKTFWIETALLPA